MADRTVKVTLTASVAGYLSGMDQAARKTREAGSEAEKLAQKRQGLVALGTAAVAFGAAITGVGVAALRTGVEYNTMQQTTRAALTSLLGSARAANEQMDKLDEFARTSPFSKQTFIQAQQQMLAFGVETRKVIPYLDAVQNAVAAAGGSNAEIAGIVATMSKIQSASKITAQDLIEFGNRGINAADLIGAAMGKTGAQIRAEISAGTLDATEALDALAKGMSSRFSGAAANVKNTFEGAVDRVKAAWRDLSAELARPLVDPNGGGALVGFLNWVADVMRGFQALPEPIKFTVTVIVGLVGAVALLGGTALLTAVKLAGLKQQLEAVGITGTKVRGALGGIGSFLAGPWGIALAVAGVAMAAFMEKQARADQLAKSYADSLDQATGALTDHTRELAKAALSTNDSWNAWMVGGQSAYDAAEKLGISLEDVTDATLGNERALQRVNKALGLNRDGSTDLAKQQEVLNRLQKEHGLSAQDATTAINVLTASIREQNTGLQDGIKIAEQKLKADGDSVESAKQVIASTEETAEAYEDLLKVLGETSEAFIDGLGAYDAVVAKNREWAQATAESTKTADDSWEDYYDGFSVSVADYLAELQRQVDAQREWQKNMADLSHRVSDETLDELARMGPEGAPLVAALVDASSDELSRLDSLFAEKSKSATDNFLGNLTSLQTQIDKFFDKNSGRSLAWGARIVMPDGSRVNTGMFADGGLMDYMGGRSIIPNAAGGIYAGGRPLYKFAEPETKWEAFISGKPSERQRNIGIWADAGERLGVWRQAQGMTSAVQELVSALGSRPGVEINQYTTTSDPALAAELTAQKLAARLAVAK